MKIVEKKFVRGMFRSWMHGKVEGNVELDSVFDIPDGVKQVWVSLHDRPAVNRAVGEIRSTTFVEQYPEICLVEFPTYDDVRLITEEALDKILKPLVGKTVHVQCEYEV